MGSRVLWWWNGKWGRLARRDVEIHHQPEAWTVEARQGGAEGHTKRFPASDEAEAKLIANQLMSTDEKWRPMP